MKKLGKVTALYAALAAWPLLMGCADPTIKDPMTPKEYIAYYKRVKGRA